LRDIDFLLDFGCAYPAPEIWSDVHVCWIRFFTKAVNSTMNYLSTTQNLICMIIMSFALICRGVLSADYSILDTVLALMFQKSFDNQSLPEM